MNWFKFYGQEYLSDPKMMGLSAIQRALWVTILCLASANDGVVEHIDEQKLMVLTGIMPTDDEWSENEGFLEIFEDLDMITIDNKMITLPNFSKRQSSNLTGYERVKRYREKHKIEAKNDNANDNARIDKIREDKNRIERDVTSTQKYLLEVPGNDLTEFTEKFTCSRSQVIDKGITLFNYCKAKGKTYKDYKAFLRNALEKDYGKRTPTMSAVDYIQQKEAEVSEEQRLYNLEKLNGMKSQLKERTRMINKAKST